MAEIQITEVVIPTQLGTPEAADFISAIAVRNAVEADGFGTDDMSYTAEEMLPHWVPNPFEPKRMFVARLDGKIVARSVYEERVGEGADAAWLQIQVVPEARGQGVGSAMADHLHALATASAKNRALTYIVSPDGLGERLAAPTGFGSVPRNNPEVRFLLGQGYTLEQVERASKLVLPVEPAELAASLAQAVTRSGGDFTVHTWRGATPPQWLEGIAMLLTRMSTDAPSAGLEEPEDPWSVERLLLEEERLASSPRTELVAAIEHIPTGTLAGFTSLDVPAETHRPVGQEDTIVLKEHRGHRLGMLLKLANIEHLERECPGHPAITTFNAEENRHMLSVNEAVGFVAIAYEGAWKKVL